MINDNKDKISSAEEYNLEDDEQENTDPVHYKLSNDGDTGQSSERADEEDVIGFGRIWGVFIRIFLSPIEGWKALKRLHISQERCNSVLLFPAIALASVASFVTDTYFDNIPIQKSLPNALETFCGFFFGYFCVLILGKIILSRQYRPALDTNFGKNFVSSVMTSLAIFDVLYEVLPMLQPVLVFLPVWTIFTLSRGVRLLGIPQDGRVQTSTVISALTIGIPIAIEWILRYLFSVN